MFDAARPPLRNGLGLHCQKMRFVSYGFRLDLPTDFAYFPIAPMFITNLRRKECPKANGRFSGKILRLASNGRSNNHCFQIAMRKRLRWRKPLYYLNISNEATIYYRRRRVHRLGVCLARAGGAVRMRDHQL